MTAFFQGSTGCLPRLLGAAMLGLLALLPSVRAQGQPGFDQARSAAAARTACAPFQGRKLSLVVPHKPGGGFDLMARAFEPILEQHSRMSVAVSNVTGANGMVAIRTVADARSDRPAIGLVSPESFINQAATTEAGPAPSDLSALGIVSTSYSVWLSRQPVNWTDPGGRVYTSATGTAPYVRFGLPAYLLGLNIRPVFGFEGSNEVWLAMLRGDIDVISLADGAVERMLGPSPQAVVSLTLTRAPHPGFPGVPYLAGRGGLVDLRTRDMAPARRKELMEQASLVVTLSEQPRMLVTSAKLPSPLQACLRHASEAALFDSASAAAAQRQKLVLEPESAEMAQSRMAVLEKSLSQNKEFLRTMAKAWTGLR